MTNTTQRTADQQYSVPEMHRIVLSHEGFSRELPSDRDHRAVTVYVDDTGPTPLKFNPDHLREAARYVDETIILATTIDADGIHRAALQAEGLAMLHKALAYAMAPGKRLLFVEAPLDRVSPWLDAMWNADDCNRPVAAFGPLGVHILDYNYEVRAAS